MTPFRRRYPSDLTYSVLILSSDSPHTSNLLLRTTFSQLWLFYWLLYAVTGFLMSFAMVEWITQLPFAIASMVLFDIYYEFQLGIVVALVNPKKRMLDEVQSHESRTVVCALQ